MDVYEGFDISIDEEQVLRLIGYSGGTPAEDILKSVREEIRLCREYIKPWVVYNRINIKDKAKDRIVLENSVIFEGDYIGGKLADCDYIIAIITTLGEEIDEVIKSSFESGDYLRGMIVDSIGTLAIEYANKLFWNRLVNDIKNSEEGITSRISPGTGGFDISAQPGVFSCFDAPIPGVLRTPSYMMTPLKTTSTMYGFGKGIGITRSEHICSECNMKSCKYRIDNKVEVKLTGACSGIIYAEVGDNLLDILRNEKINIGSPCGGSGTCGKCRIVFKNGASKPSEIDKMHLSPEEIKNGVRLACETRLYSPAEIEIPGLEDSMNILVDAQDVDIKVEPDISKKYLPLSSPSLTDQRSDFMRIKDGLGILELECKPGLMARIPEILRSGDFKVTAVLNNDTLIGLEEGDTTKKIYGTAVDIGTTTIACYLVDMLSGKVVDVESAVNTQKAYGADVISRINFTMENKNGGEILKSSIITQINEMLSNLGTRAGIPLYNIYIMTIVGNTTMSHLLLGLPCMNIALSPYIPVTTGALKLYGEELGLNFGGGIKLLPGISSYVGSDITAGIIASSMMKSKKHSILLDLGTNGEIALGSSEGVVTCSTAAGPAFEGANITWGVGGIRGAISKIDLSRDKIYETIGGDSPCGICGSGVLDMTYQLLKYKLIDKTGKMAEIDELDCPEKLKNRMKVREGKKEFVIDGDIVFTQKDVREVQLAVAAVSAGIKILLKEKGILPEAVENIFIAGGFGNFMDAASAIGLGIIPRELFGRVKSIGNSAGMGARMCLLSREQGKEIEKTANNTRYIELSGRQDFQDYFIDSMMLGGSD